MTVVVRFPQETVQLARFPNLTLLGLPMNIVAAQVHYGEHADLVVSNSVKHPIRKMVNDGVANVAMKDLVLLGFRRNPL